MYTTVDSVARQTGYVVTPEVILQAQVIIESYTGRVEARVSDPNDKAILARATGFQAAYMEANPSLVYKQVAMKSTMQNDNSATFDTNLAAPFIAPLAAMAVRGLSWKRSRSVKVGSMFDSPSVSRWDAS